MAVTYNDIVQQTSIKQFMPIYVLQGDEPYYIDALTELIEASVLTDDEKVFNETTLYGKDINMENVLSSARLAPMMAPYRLIFLKELQQIKSDSGFAALEAYLQQPTSTTILVLTYKGGKFDARKKWLKQAEKLGVVYTSVALKERELPPVIERFADNHGLSIDDTSITLLTEYVGADLTRIESIMQQFDTMLSTGKRTITPALIEKVVGISKDYNALELTNAVIDKDIRKVNLIIAHTSEFITPITGALFSRFENLIIYQYLPNKRDSNAVAAALRCSPNAVWAYEKAAKKYTPMQVFRAIGYLRRMDIMSKGVECGDSTNTTGLLKETLYRIMH